MIYDLIVDALLKVVNASADTWQYLTIEIVSIILSIFLFLAFFFLPLFIAFEIINLPNDEDTGSGYKRKKRKR